MTSHIIANIARANMHLGNAEKAEHYFDKYRDLLNERGTTEFQRTLSEMEIKYETEKKELRINVLEEKRSEEHTSELQSLMRISYAVFCLKKKKITNKEDNKIKK